MKATLVALLVPLLLTAPAGAAEDIRGNSFLLEEAYNQEPGVLHHINRFQLSLEEVGGFEYRLVEELPLFSQTHQLSVQLPVVNLGKGLPVGVGDVQIDYRLQAIGGDRRTELAFAPRLSVIVPSGSTEKGHGLGGFGAQIDFPISVSVRSWLSSHTNLGGTIVPLPNRVPDELEPEEGEETFVAAHAAQSFVWLPHTNFNVLVEVLWQALELAQDPLYTLVVSPGLRGKLDFENSLQIVLGAAVPLGVGPQNKGTKALLFYLSFEHEVPFLGGGQESLLSGDRY